MAAIDHARRLVLHCMPESASRLRRLNAFARTILALSAASFMLTIAACSSNSTQNKAASTRVSAQEKFVQERPIEEKSATYRSATAIPRPVRQSHPSNRTIVAHLPAPDCEFKGQEPETVDAEQWARLKLDYERHCYEQAEMTARNRLELLLASGKCRVGSN
jgi:hypothetical protein